MTSLPEERFIMKEENPNQWIDKGLYFFSWEKTRKKAQAIWLKNTLLLPQGINEQGINGDRTHFLYENVLFFTK